MAQSLEEQMNMVERALGERMVNHALALVRAWMQETGDEPALLDEFNRIYEAYKTLFNDWLVEDKDSYDTQLDELTGRAYRLVDAIYIRLRLKRGLSPEMHGFNGDNAQSVAHYFGTCLTLTEGDFEWLRMCLQDEERAAIGLMAIASLAKNLREVFNEQAIRVLIEGINAANSVVGEQCLANLIILMAHYDVRIDFFPELQDTLTEALDDGQTAFEVMCALVRSSYYSLRDLMAENEKSIDDLPSELKALLDSTGAGESLETVSAWVPASEKEYISGLIQILPDTWIYSLIIGEDLERQQTMKFIYLSIGRMDLLWNETEAAERWLVNHLRGNKVKPIDYINYGHCLLLRGDRIMAFENYRQAREMCKNSKSFLTLFRPDRHQLVEHGVPLEQVYLIEDQLLNI